jgi:hypothetical protein
MLRQLLRFTWNEKAYILLLPLSMFFATLWHEASHALMALFQGATVTEFSIVPSVSPSGYFRFGYISYIWQEPLYSVRLISLAPFFSCTFLALSAPLYLARLPEGFPRKCSLIFLYFVPLADIGMQLKGLFYRNAESDYFRALRGFETPVALSSLLFFSYFGWLGYRLFRAAYGDALRPAAFTVGYLFVLSASWILR